MLVGGTCKMDFIVTDCGRVVTELEEQLREFLFTLTQLSELNSFVLVVTKDTLMRDE